MKFSVLISVYNKEKPSNLEQCLQSLLDQSLLADEIVLVEDGPISKALNEVIQHFKQVLPIKAISLKNNGGLASALNTGLDMCENELIIRMDTDDISLPNRFLIQVSFMRNHPNISVCSAFIEERSSDMSYCIGIRKIPTTHQDIIKFARTRSPISHPAVIYKKSAVLEVGGYPLIFPEDYLLWCKMLVHNYQFANIPEILLYMRTDDDMLARRGRTVLIGHVKTYLFMKSSGLIGWSLLFRNISIQLIVRLSPLKVRKLFYRYARN